MPTKNWTNKNVDCFAGAVDILSATKLKVCGHKLQFTTHIDIITITNSSLSRYTHGHCSLSVFSLSVYGLLSLRLDRCRTMCRPRLWPMHRARQKSKPLGKIRYLWNCSKFFRQIYTAYRRGIRPHNVQISLQYLQYLVVFKSYNYLNLNVHCSKWTSRLIKLRFWLKNNLADI